MEIKKLGMVFQKEWIQNEIIEHRGMGEEWARNGNASDVPKSSRKWDQELEEGAWTTVSGPAVKSRDSVAYSKKMRKLLSHPRPALGI